MAEKGKCTGNCMDCNLYQRQYCSSQIAYNNMGILGGIVTSIEALAGKVADLSEKIAVIQCNDTALINPIEEE